MAVFVGLQDFSRSSFDVARYLHRYYDGAIDAAIELNLVDAQLAGTIQPFRYGPWFAPNGAKYLILQCDLPDAGPGVQIVSSTDGGTTWTQMPAKSSSDYFRASSATLAGAVLYIAGYIGPASSHPPITIARFETSSNSWLSDITGGPTPDHTDARGIAPYNTGLGVRPNGDLVLAYSGPVETVAGASHNPYARVYVSAYAGSWGAGVKMPGQTGLKNFFYPLAVETIQASGRSHVAAEGRADILDFFDAPILVACSFDSANAFHAPQTLAGDGDTSGSVNPYWGLAGQWKVGAVDYIGIPYIGDFDGSNQTIRFVSAADADDPSWANVLVSDAVLAANQQVQNATSVDEVPLSFSADASGVDLYWIHGEGDVGAYTGANQYIYHSKSADNGASWSAPDVFHHYAANLSPFSVLAGNLAAARKRRNYSYVGILGSNLKP